RQWNPAYFQRLNDLMNAARAQGIVVELTLFCPFYNDALWLANPMHANNNVNGIGNCPREEVYALQHADLTDMQLAFVSKVVQELQGFDNLYFEICNEPYFGGVTMEWQHRVADTIRAVERELPHQHLISRNVANGRARVEKPHPGISIFNFHYCVPPDAVALNAHLQGVIGENETGFR
ncbi:MAG: cellulase family glycosylhydrolase, partial [Planctomycetales bacterium]|nr:cellulase family glycosylhydrolase [Planctomycetales bacterium]